MKGARAAPPAGGSRHLITDRRIKNDDGQITLPVVDTSFLDIITRCSLFLGLDLVSQPVDAGCGTTDDPKVVHGTEKRNRRDE